MNKSDSIANLAEALSKAQAEFTHAPLNSVNPFLKNKYADLGSVIQSVRPAMTKNGLSITQSVSADNGIVTVETMLLHSSGEWISQDIGIPVDQSKGMSLAQSIGAVVTYLRRYSIAAMMGVYADEDNDGNDEKQQKPSAAKPAPVQKPATMAAAGEPEQPQSMVSAAAELGAVVAPVVYTGKTAKIGKNAYPAEWAKAVAINISKLGGNEYHIDGILQKLALAQNTDADAVLDQISAHLNKEA